MYIYNEPSGYAIPSGTKVPTVVFTRIGSPPPVAVAEEEEEGEEVEWTTKEELKVFTVKPVKPTIAVPRITPLRRIREAVCALPYMLREI